MTKQEIPLSDPRLKEFISSDREIPFLDAVSLSDPRLVGLTDPRNPTEDDIIARLYAEPVIKEVFRSDSPRKYPHTPQEQAVLALRFGVDYPDLADLEVPVHGVPTSFYELDDNLFKEPAEKPSLENTGVEPSKDPSLQDITDVLGVAKQRVIDINANGLKKGLEIANPQSVSRRSSKYSQ